MTPYVTCRCPEIYRTIHFVVFSDVLYNYSLNTFFDPEYQAQYA